MGIAEMQLKWVDGEVIYESLDLGEMNTLRIPSADFATIREWRAEGKVWGERYDPLVDERPEVEHTLDDEAIREDMPEYVDGKFVQYIRSGGPCGFRLPFRKVAIEKNYKMSRNGEKKTREKFEEELKRGYVGLRVPEKMPIFRETKQGAIPKAREDRKKKEEGKEHRCRTISDFSAIGKDGVSINKEAGEFLKIDLPQGERVHRNIWEVRDWCTQKGLDPRKIKGVKIDIKSAFRTLSVHPSDYWALGFQVGERRAFHRRWPFGLKTSVYNFLRLPLLIISYLVEKTDFDKRGIRAAMYFDDLIILAHESEIEDATRTVLELFERWKIPRQDEKFLEDNPHGAKGSRRLTILGIEYDFATLTVAISRSRIDEIVEEMKSRMEEKKGLELRKWESTIGVVNWVATAIPQIRMYLTTSWGIVKTMKRKFGNRRMKIRMSKDMRHDWGEIIHQLKVWNGSQKILRGDWEEIPKEGFDQGKDYIAPASDASGTHGWGAICTKGYAYGVWDKEEKELPIHIKEGLALYALVALFGKDLSRKKVKVNLTMRCDNQSLVNALKRGRAKDKNLALVMRLIVEEMVKADTMLKFWRTGNKTEVRVEYITSKSNKLADDLSRGDRIASKGKNKGKKAMNSSDSFTAYLAAVQRATKERGGDWNPTGILEEVVKRIARQYGAGMNRKLPLFISMVNEMEDEGIFDERNSLEAQTIVIMLFTIFGMLRISETLRLDWRDIVIEEALEMRTNGDREIRKLMTLTLRKTKTSKGQNAPPEYAVIGDRIKGVGDNKDRWDPIRMFRKWKSRCEDYGIDTTRGKVFSIKRSDYEDNMKKALEGIGVESTKYGTHSGRIGGATMLWEAGAKDSEIMELGRWRSDCWKIYCRQVKEKCLRLSRMLNGSELRRGSLVGNRMDLTVEVDDMVS
eukprot:g10295.t1